MLGEIVSRKMILSVKCLLQNTIIIAICIFLIFSSFICIFQGKTLSNNESDNYIDLIEKSGEDNLLLPQNTRSGDDEYLNLVWGAGHGTEIGRENAIVSADVDNDGIREVISRNGIEIYR